MRTEKLNTSFTLGALDADRYLISEDGIDISRPSRPVDRVSIDTDAGQTVVDANRTAMLVIDMQNDFCTEGGWLHTAGASVEGMRTPIGPINRVNERLRARNLPVIWLNWGNRSDLRNVPATVQFPFHQLGRGVGLSAPQPANSHAAKAEGSRVLEKDSWGAQVVDELLRMPTDIMVDKYRISGFWDTQLDSILRKHDIRTLLFAGVNADQCVLATLMDATFHGYDAFLIGDCVATSSPGYCMESTVYNVRSVFGFVTDSDRVVHGFSR